MKEILLFTANASYLGEYLDLEKELREILDALQRARARDHYRPWISPAVTFARVVAELDDRRPAIVHFSAHGKDGGLVLLDEQRVAPREIADLFAKLADSRFDLVVFASCESDVLAEAVVEHVDHAIGWVGMIADEVVHQFSKIFYERLTARPHPQVARAFELTCVALRGSGVAEVEQARLFARARPDGDDVPPRRYSKSEFIESFASRLAEEGIDAKIAETLATILRPHGFRTPKAPRGFLGLMVPVAYWIIRDDDLDLAKSMILGVAAAATSGVLDGNPSTASIAGIVGAVLNSARAARAKGARVSPLHYELLLVLKSRPEGMTVAEATDALNSILTSEVEDGPTLRTADIEAMLQELKAMRVRDGSIVQFVDVDNEGRWQGTGV